MLKQLKICRITASQEINGTFLLLIYNCQDYSPFLNRVTCSSATSVGMSGCRKTSPRFPFTGIVFKDLEIIKLQYFRSQTESYGNIYNDDIFPRLSHRLLPE
jgi:hypothetical protein